MKSKGSAAWQVLQRGRTDPDHEVSDMARVEDHAGGRGPHVTSHAKRFEDYLIDVEAFPEPGVVST